MSSLKLVKTCMVKDTVVGDKITYNLICSNDTNIVFDNIVVTDLLSCHLKFVKNSVKINNIDKPNLNITTGASIGKLGIGKKIIISFEVKIISKEEDIIGTVASAEGFYKKDEDVKSIITTSMPCVINVSDPSLYILKSVNKTTVSLDDKVTYTIKLVNNGDVYLNNICLNDNISESIEVVEGSFSINGNTINGIDLKEEINLGDLQVNDYVIIKYEAIVVGKGFNCKIANDAFARYGYKFSNGTIRFKNSEISSCSLKVSLASFKQTSIDKYIDLAPHKDDIEYINNIDTKITIKNYNTIKTPVATSSEGQVLSGYKLIIHGKISQIIQYTAKTPNQPVHSLENEASFSSFIILPYDHELGSKIHIEGVIENTYHNLVNSRCIFESINILLIAKTLK